MLAEKASIVYDPALWDPVKLANVCSASAPIRKQSSNNRAEQEIEDFGFGASPITAIEAGVAQISIYGMHCASCTSTIEKAFLATPGVLSASVVLHPGSARVTYDTSLLGLRDLITLVEDRGFDAVLADEESKLTQLRSLARTREITEWRRAFHIAAAIALPVFFLSMICPMVWCLKPIINYKLLQGIYLGDMICFFLTIPVQFIIGSRFYKSAYKAIKHKSATMDTLVVISTSTTFFYSTFAMFTAPLISSSPDYHPKLFFETSSMLIAFITLGRYTENMAKGKTSVALSKLMSLTPSSATIYTDEKCTQEKRIPTELVQNGDIVKIIPGDKLPADGCLMSGASDVDESMITGEALPVHKTPGEMVIGGTVNGSGTFDMRVTKAGRDTALSQIVSLVEEAQTSKAPIQAFADTVAGYFVPTVVVLGISTFFGWMIISHNGLMDPLPMFFRDAGTPNYLVCMTIAISVIVVACPCALGLSTPTAVMVGTGVGAQHGILIKGAGPLEASKSINKIVLDKTGTLTTGKMVVAGVSWSDSLFAQEEAWRQEALLAVYATESKSEHPLANAVADYVRSQLNILSLPEEIKVHAFENTAGKGVTASISTLNHHSREIVIGNAALLSSHNVSLPPAMEEFRAAHQSLGRTVISAAIDQSLTCLFAISDTIKPEARQTVEALRMLGVSVSMVTGDQLATAAAIAREVGIDEHDVYAGVSPAGKREIVCQLQGEGYKVAMVCSRPIN